VQALLHVALVHHDIPSRVHLSYPSPQVRIIYTMHASAAQTVTHFTRDAFTACLACAPSSLTRILSLHVVFEHKYRAALLKGGWVELIFWDRHYRRQFCYVSFLPPPLFCGPADLRKAAIPGPLGSSPPLTTDSAP
jgi:hypothetical protein